MNIMQMMKQAQQLQSKMEAMQAELESLEVEGQSGGGLVRVTLSGKMTLKSIKIDPSLLKPEEGEILEDLILAAHQDAKGKAERAMQERMQEVTGGLPLPPGLKLF
ncbi:MAG: YbaB/EbfC family nucleoid-associated protein [Hyphomicrobiaceae bacterium]